MIAEALARVISYQRMNSASSIRAYRFIECAYYAVILFEGCLELNGAELQWHVTDKPVG